MEKKMKIRKDIIIKILIVLFLITLICVIIFYILRLNTEYMESYNFYQYFAGRKIEYEGVLKITKRNGITRS